MDECTYCGIRRYSFSEEGVREKLKAHSCLGTLTNTELDEILDRILKENDGS